MTTVEIYVYPENGAFDTAGGERAVHVLGHIVYREMGSLQLTTAERPDVSTIDLNRFQFLPEFPDINFGAKRAEKRISHAFGCAVTCGRVTLQNCNN